MLGSMVRIAVVVAALLAACGGGGAAPPPAGGGNLQSAALLLSAGLENVAPAPDTFSAAVDLARLGMAGVDRVYDLTTPAGEPFVFDLVSRAEGNTGAVRVSVSHAADGGIPPAGGAETLSQAGIAATGGGLAARGPWLDATGDGFTRLTCSGAIDADQVLAVEVDDGERTATALVRVRIGPASPINPAAGGGGDYPGVVERRALYSSDSLGFGLPTCAIAFDTSIVCYEGDRANPFAYERFELRLQFDERTGVVTGGAERETSPDFGNWRDHEIAALFNVIALVRSGSDEVVVKISFDRGASFGQEVRFPAGGQGSARLVQIAMADDYSLGVLYWRSNPDLSSDLVLVEGHPSAFDGTGSPSQFAFDPPRVVYRNPADVTPLLMGAVYTGTGDFVVGYGFSRFRRLPDGTFESLTQFRCLTRRFGEGAFMGALVDENRIVGRDPSVAVIGDRILLAAEATDGVRVYESLDFGRTWAPVETVGEPGAHMPSIFARPRGGEVRVDMLYIAHSREGRELHLAVWDDFGTARREDYRLTEAKTEIGDDPPPGPRPLAQIAPGGFEVTQLAWFGYDAALDGDDLVVVYDEETFDAFEIFLGAPVSQFDDGALGTPAPSAPFEAAEPPPIKDGLKEPMPPPDLEDAHVLHWLRLD